MGANSHMATVAFNNYIGFCEDYVKELHKALHAIEGGRTEEPLDPRRFSRIREKWALWLTHEMENELDQFERKFATDEWWVFDAKGALVSNENIVKEMIAGLRGALHTEELTALRGELVMRSSIKPRHLV